MDEGAVKYGGYKIKSKTCVNCGICYCKQLAKKVIYIMNIIIICFVAFQYILVAVSDSN